MNLTRNLAVLVFLLLSLSAWGDGQANVTFDVKSEKLGFLQPVPPPSPEPSVQSIELPHQLRSERRLVSTISGGKIVNDVIQNDLKPSKVITSCYSHIAAYVSLLQGGASARDLAAHSVVTIGHLIGSGIGAKFPLVGLVVTIASSLFGGFIQSLGKTDPLELLYDAIMKEVKSVIDQNKILDQLRTARHTLESLTDELMWVPDVLEFMPEATQLSWELTVQHSLESSWHSIFGHCWDHPCPGPQCSSQCLQWQEAGSIELELPFAALHITLVSRMSATLPQEAREVFLQRLRNLADRYEPLLRNSLARFKKVRNVGGVSEAWMYTKSHNPGCNPWKNGVGDTGCRDVSAYCVDAFQNQGSSEPHGPGVLWARLGHCVCPSHLNPNAQYANTCTERGTFHRKPELCPKGSFCTPLNLTKNIPQPLLTTFCFPDWVKEPIRVCRERREELEAMFAAYEEQLDALFRPFHHPMIPSTMGAENTTSTLSHVSATVSGNQTGEAVLSVKACVPGYDPGCVPGQ